MGINQSLDLGSPPCAHMTAKFRIRWWCAEGESHSPAAAVFKLFTLHLLAILDEQGVTVQQGHFT